MLNIPEYSVTELSRSLKETLENNYARVRVKGEISSCKKATSGHLYLSLKDEYSLIDAIIWRGTALKLKIVPEDGLEVLVTGKITTYSPRSRYQLIIENLEIEGEGALLKLIQDRKIKLEGEGYFDSDKKKELPLLPLNIGIITSPIGAALQDMLKTINDRFPSRIILWPVLVQGENADKEISNAINGFNKIKNIKDKPDVIILGRGGGSIEDLMAFNSLNVVYSIAESDIPIISAVGHENDNSLSDLVADIRAATPTAAAEMVVPIRSEMRNNILGFQQRLLYSVYRKVDSKVKIIKAYSSALGKPDKIFEMIVQKVDYLGYKLNTKMSEDIKRRNINIKNINIKRPFSLYTLANNNLMNNNKNLSRTLIRYIEKIDLELNSSIKILEARSFQLLLKKGFALVRNKKNRLIRSISDIKAQSEIKVQMYDGSISAEVKKVKKDY